MNVLTSDGVMTGGHDGWELNFMLKDGGVSKGMGGLGCAHRVSLPLEQLVFNAFEKAP